MDIAMFRNTPFNAVPGGLTCDLPRFELRPPVGDEQSLSDALGFLKENWRHDPEAAHSFADALKSRVLELVAQGHPAAADLARAVLVIDTWKVECWCA